MIYTICPYVNGDGFSGVHGNWDINLKPLIQYENYENYLPVIFEEGLAPKLPTVETYTRTFSLPTVSENESLDYIEFTMEPQHGTLVAMYAIYVSLTSGLRTRRHKLGDICTIGTYSQIGSANIPKTWARNNCASFQFYLPLSASDIGKKIRAFDPTPGVKDGAAKNSCFIVYQESSISTVWATFSTSDPDMVSRKIPFRILLPTGIDTSGVTSMQDEITRNKQLYDQGMTDVARSIDGIRSDVTACSVKADKAMQTAESTYNTIQSRFAVR